MGFHPLHGAYCRTWVYAWRCPECEAAVKVFACTCGSWVMFDALGAPWPQHSCFHARYKALVDKVMPIIEGGRDPRSASFRPFEPLGEWIDPHRLAPSVAEAETPFEPAEASGIAGRPEHVIKKMAPVAEGETHFFLGVVRERIEATTAIKAIYKALGTVGQRSWKLPAPSHAIQLTIVDTKDQPNESYTAIADKGLVEGGVRVGVLVGVYLVGHVSPSAKVWKITDVQAI